MFICFVLSSILKTSNSKCSEKHYIGCLGDVYLQQYSVFDSIFFPQFHTKHLSVHQYVFYCKAYKWLWIQTQSQNFPDNPGICFFNKTFQMADLFRHKVFRYIFLKLQLYKILSLCPNLEYLDLTQTRISDLGFKG